MQTKMTSYKKIFKYVDFLKKKIRLSIMGIFQVKAFKAINVAQPEKGFGLRLRRALSKRQS